MIYLVKRCFERWLFRQLTATTLGLVSWRIAIKKTNSFMICKRVTGGHNDLSLPRLLLICWWVRAAWPRMKTLDCPWSVAIPTSIGKKLVIYHRRNFSKLDQSRRFLALIKPWTSPTPLRLSEQSRSRPIKSSQDERWRYREYACLREWLRPSQGLVFSWSWLSSKC